MFFNKNKNGNPELQKQCTMIVAHLLNRALPFSVVAEKAKLVNIYASSKMVKMAQLFAPVIFNVAAFVRQIDICFLI